MSVKAALMRVREMLAKEENWTRCTSARDAQENPVGICSELAVKFCLLGAVWRVDCPELVYTLQRAIEQLERRKDGVLLQSVAQFNDCSTHAEVIELLDSMIRSDYV